MLVVVLCLTLSFLLYKLFDYIWRLPTLPLSQNTQYILVTGCDTGFGNLFAKRLDSKGFTVFAGCLLEEGVLSITESCSRSAKPFLLDVTDDESVSKSVDFVRKTSNDKG